MVTIEKLPSRNDFEDAKRIPLHGTLSMEKLLSKLQERTESQIATSSARWARGIAYNVIRKKLLKNMQGFC